LLLELLLEAEELWPSMAAQELEAEELPTTMAAHEFHPTTAEGHDGRRRSLHHHGSCPALFTCLMSRTFSANEQYFSLTTNQRTVLSPINFQRSEVGEVILSIQKYNDVVYACC
jgi:hypothetical protein